MTRVLLFVIDEEAKSVARDVANVKFGSEPNMTTLYFLVESNELPADQFGFKTELQDGDTFESDFIGASPEECQEWALEKQFEVNYIEQNIIGIIDARTAQDKTILMSCFIDADMCEPPLMQFPPFGTLPRSEQADTWINYRIKYEDGPTLFCSWNYGDEDAILPGYLGNKENFTDEDGVFDVSRAEEYNRTYRYSDHYAGPPRI